MSRLSEAFKKRKALITYITAGDPDLAVTEKLVLALEKAGADIVELGIPFSDPLADGPVIQASHQRALKKNTSLASVFKSVKNLRRKTSIPICFMLAYNLVLQYGTEKFAADCERFGVDGVIIPDLPPEEIGTSYLGLGTRDSGQGTNSLGLAPSNLALVTLVAPTSTDERIKLAVEKSSGFVYLISVAGITGQRKSLMVIIRFFLPGLYNFCAEQGKHHKFFRSFYSHKHHGHIGAQLLSKLGESSAIIAMITKHDPLVEPFGPGDPLELKILQAADSTY